MALSAGSKRVVACPFEECSGDQWCPHAVQVALATDRVGTPGRDGAQIASQNVIDAGRQQLMWGVAPHWIDTRMRDVQETRMKIT